MGKIAIANMRTLNINEDEYNNEDGSYFEIKCGRCWCSVKKYQEKVVIQ